MQQYFKSTIIRCVLLDTSLKLNIGLHSKSAWWQYIHMSIKPPVQTLLDLIRFM